VNPLVDSNWFGPVPNPQRHFMLTGRFDHRFSEKDNLYVRATRNTYDVITSTGGNLPQGLPMFNPEVNNYENSAPNADLAISEVHIFSPTLFNEFLVSARRDTRGVNNDRSTAWADQLGLPNPLNAVGWPYLSGTGLGNLVYVSGGRQGSAENLYILDDGFTKVRGPHQLQFGVHVRLDQMNVLPDLTGALGVHDWGTGATALYDPTSSRTNPLVTPQTGQNLANMFLGVMNYSTRFSRGYYYTRSQEYALYLQDNYKVTPRLTLNLGLRWELWPALSEKNYAMSSWDPKNRAVVLGQDLNTLYRMGATLPSIVNRLQALGAKFETYKDAGLPQSLRYGNSRNFGPRLGFAYRAGDGRSAFVVRGGYRISYFAPVVQQWTADMRYETPFEAQFQTQLNNAAQSPDGIPNYNLRSVPKTFAGVNSRNAVDLSNAGSITRGTERLVYFDPHQPDSRVQDWNLTIEKPFASNMVARVGYVGNHSDHLQQTYFYNEAAPDYVWYTTTGLAFPTGEFANVARRPYDQTTFGTFEEYLKSGYSNFNGMQFEFERRYHKGFGYQIFYNINNALAATGQINSANQFLPGSVPTDFDQLNRFQNYSRDTGVPRHSVRWNWIVDLPFGKGRSIARNAGGLLNKVIGGWQLAGLGFLRSTWFALPTGVYPNGQDIEFYGYKYPIQDCRSGACWPGYLWWNGYIPANQINSVDANGKPNGVEGVPSSYKPAAQPILPWPANPNRNDPSYQFYGTNTIFVPLKNGTLQRTTYNTGLNAWQNQFFPGVRQWNMDASLFKNVSLHDRLRLRFNIDFFNVFNHPGNPAAIGGDGILDTRASGNPARVLQLTMRLSW
jgi:hypothetical protein